MRNEKFQIHFHAQYSVIYKGAKLGGDPPLFLPRLKIIYSPSSANVMGTFLVEIHVIEVSYKTSIFSAPPRTYLCICPTAFKPQLLPLHYEKKCNFRTTYCSLLGSNSQFSRVGINLVSVISQPRS